MPWKKYIESSFGERLQNLRKARGLTQVHLAEAAETTRRAVPYYEAEAVFRLISSLVAARSLRRNGALQGGERHGR